jgi:transcription elongation factor GreB
VSRAFVKDADDGEPERGFDRPVSNAPNYVTQRGLERLRDDLARAEREGNEREARYYRGRVESAIVVDLSAQRGDQVEFGATVDAHDAAGKKLRVRIVGEDEADPIHGTISWESPVAQAFQDHRVGDTVTVLAPAGPIEYTIDAIAYG